MSPLWAPPPYPETWVFLVLDWSVRTIKKVHFTALADDWELRRRFPKNAEKLHCCGKASHAQRQHPEWSVIPSALPTAAATTAHCSPASGNEVLLTASSTWSRRRDVDHSLFCPAKLWMFLHKILICVVGELNYWPPFSVINLYILVLFLFYHVGQIWDQLNWSTSIHGKSSLR